MSVLAWLFLVFAILLFSGIPVSVGLGLTSLFYCVITGNYSFILMIPKRMFAGMNSFVIMAIPLFMLTGSLMNKGGVTTRLIKLSDLLVGRLRGGLAHVNVLASMLFAGITGSALSDIAAMGSVLVPAMVEDGYDKEFSTAVTAASAIQGPIIPPSIPAVLVAAVTGISTGALFLGGAIPGMLLGVGCFIIIFFLARKRKYPKNETKYTKEQIFKIIKDSIVAIMAPVIILGGILSGIFTPTEAAGIAVLYSFVVAVLIYKNVGLKSLINIMKETIIQSSKIYFIIGVATSFAWFLSLERFPDLLTNILLSYSGGSTWKILLILNVILLLWGMFISTNPGILILGPILFPIIQSFGINPVHFGVIMIVNFMIGLITPPFGVGLFSAVAIGEVSLIDLIKELWPFLIIELAVLCLVTFVPAISLFLPRLFGLI
ncbi:MULTISPECIES: TRAP transporter large permease [Halanaerobiaceae]|uniref:TRAP transporter large permease n=1 Tax=Halanaerobiaceae TaxID=972 RepID=UPI0013E05339|nr:MULTISPECIES: TRAP transporter large permease [Halanaerobiaceae]